MVESSRLRSEYNLDQLIIEQKEYQIYKLHKDFKIEKALADFWFDRFKFVAQRIQDSLLHGLSQFLLVRNNLSFKDVTNSYVNLNASNKDQLSSLRSFMSSRSASELFEKIHSCYISVTANEMRMYSFVGARKPMCDLPLGCIETLTFDCNTQMAKFDIVTATGSEKRYLFIIHETANDFKKWMAMVPSILKKHNVKISV